MKNKSNSDSPLGNGNPRQLLKKKYQPLGTIVKFPKMNAHATIQASKEAGGGTYELDGNGFMSFILCSTNSPEEMAVNIDDIRIDFKPIKIKIPNLETVEIPGFTITKCDLDLEKTSGIWYKSDSEIKMKLAIKLDPDHIPIMRRLGFNEAVTVTAVESGPFDWRKGRRLETHAAPFKLPPPLDFLTVSAGQFDVCAVRADLRVATECHLARENSANEIWICPGDEACLAWDVSGSPTNVTLSPPGGSVSANDTRIVTPMATTTYRLIGQDQSCDDSDQVTVRVVRAGESIFNMQANWNPWEGCVWIFQLPEALVSKSVMGVEMRHVRCDGGLATWPEWSFIHTDPDGNVFSGNVRVNEWRNITDQWLAGIWRFSPVGIGTCRPPEGSNGWEPACFEVKLGCR